MRESLMPTDSTPESGVPGRWCPGDQPLRVAPDPVVN